MMKHNPQIKKDKKRLGITTRIWFSIMLVAVSVIAIIWIFQVVFLERFYETHRKNNLKNVLAEIQTVVQSDTIENSQVNLLKLASEQALCIDISTYDGKEIVAFDALGYSCYIHKNEENYNNILKYAQSADNQDFLRLQNSKDKTGYFVGVIKTTANVNGLTTDVIIMISQNLPPVAEATNVIQTQLIIISMALLILATVVALLLSRTITKPIVKITEATRRVAEGSNDVHVDALGNDEIGDLANNFNYMIEEINKANILERELIANISHDLRTPLTMIRGYAEMIKDLTGDNKEKREEQLDIIVEETDRLSKLVSDVMDLSKLQAGKMSLNETEFSITKKIQDIVKRFSLLENTNGFEFNINIQEELLVKGDETRVEQVIYNLMNNAVNHIGERKIITISAFRVDNNEVQISVTDTGTGIKQEDLPLIWDRYYKPYRQGKSETGNGLGLSIVKAILIKHDSRFGVQSQLNVGSTFWFTLKSVN